MPRRAWGKRLLADCPEQTGLPEVAEGLLYFLVQYDPLDVVRRVFLCRHLLNVARNLSQVYFGMKEVPQKIDTKNTARQGELHKMKKKFLKDSRWCDKNGLSESFKMGPHLICLN